MIFFQTAQDVVDVIDNVMKMKREDLKESQRANKASSKYENLHCNLFCIIVLPLMPRLFQNFNRS